MKLWVLSHISLKFKTGLALIAEFKGVSAPDVSAVSRWSSESNYYCSIKWLIVCFILLIFKMFDLNRFFSCLFLAAWIWVCVYKAFFWFPFARPEALSDEAYLDYFFSSFFYFLFVSCFIVSCGIAWSYSGFPSVGSTKSRSPPPPSWSKSTKSSCYYWTSWIKPPISSSSSSFYSSIYEFPCLLELSPFFAIEFTKLATSSGMSLSINRSNSDWSSSSCTKSSSSSS